LDPKATLSRFKKSVLLLKIGSADEALNQLLVIKDSAPEDPNLHFYLGLTYKRLRLKTDAIRHFTISLNLDPKAQSHIKEAMENWDDDPVGWSDEDEV